MDVVFLKGHNMGAVRFSTYEHRAMARTATGIADKLIASEGIRKARIIASLANENVIANYKSLKRKYPKEYK